MVISEYVAVSIKGMNVKRYEGLGYIIPKRRDKQGRLASNTQASLLVMVCDLPTRSEARIDVICDYCGEVKTMQYKNYTIQTEKDIIKKDSCVKCRWKKIEESNLKVYGVKSTMEVPYLRKKQEDSNREDIDIVKADFLKMGLIPMFDTYKNDREPLEYICENHPDIIQTKTYGSIKAKEDCRFCAMEGTKGVNHHNWKGGISALRVYIHNTPSIKRWKRDSLKYRGGVCVKTRQRKNLAIHHAVKSFSDILHQALDDIGLDIRADISKYTYEELHKIEMRCSSLHYWYGFGYPIVEEEHIKFHKKYGYKEFTEDDFNSFVYGYCDKDYYTGALLGE